MTRDLDIGICSVCLLLSAQLGSLIKAWGGEGGGFIPTVCRPGLLECDLPSDGGK